MPALSRASPKILREHRDLRASFSSSCRSYGLSHRIAGPIDVQRRIARQKGEMLARRARSHGGFLARSQSVSESSSLLAARDEEAKAGAFAYVAGEFRCHSLHRSQIS